MKIYKIAQNFQILPQNPDSPNDPNVQLQNLQNSQQALQYFQEVIQTYNNTMSALGEIEDTLGLGDVNFRGQFSEMMKSAIQQTPAFNLLAHMNMIASVDNLLDQNELSSIENLINTNISSISDQYSEMQQNQNGQMSGQMGGFSIS